MKRLCIKRQALSLFLIGVRFQLNPGWLLACCWPGLAPAGEVLFFASPKKSTQKKGDPAVRVLALRSGQPAVLGHGACRRTHCALRASFKQLRQVSPQSMGARAPMPTPQAPRPRRSPRGLNSLHRPLLFSAPMGAGASRRAAPGRAQRWPVSRVPFWPCRGAQGAGRAGAAGRQPS